MVIHGSTMMKGEIEMSTATKVIRQIAAGQVSGPGIKKKADAIVANSTATACKNGKKTP